MVVCFDPKSDLPEGINEKHDLRIVSYVYQSLNLQENREDHLAFQKQDD